MKVSYLCNVERGRRRSAVGSWEYLSGAPKFPPCAGRKNRKSDIDNANESTIITNHLKNFTNYGNESEGSREAAEV